MSGYKYAELAAKLREEIRSGAYACGERLPSENELSAQTGYSRQTVRQAMSVLERDGLTCRVRGSGTYVRAAALKRERTRNVAVITTYISEYIFPDILRGINRVLEQSGYTALLSATHNRVENERRILTDLLSKPIDGLIVEGSKTALPNPNLDLYAELRQKGVPSVFINGEYPALTHSVAVLADDFAGGRLACDTLLRKGHRAIAGLFKSDDLQGHRRFAGYAEALRQAGLSVVDDHVLWFATENRDRLLEACLGDALAGCTAAVCYNDECAMRVSQLMTAQHLPPVELMSFDNSVYARLSGAPFRSLAGPTEQLGALAAQKLLHLLDGETVTSAVLPWSLEDAR